MTETLTLRLSCDDRPGLVMMVAGFLTGQGGNIIDAQHGRCGPRTSGKRC
jgi:formyltetrahydrofolate deformylase